MKKLILFLTLFSFLSIQAQVSTGQEQEFETGIKNNAAQTVTTPINVVTQGSDGTLGKTLAGNLIEVLEYSTASAMPVTGVSGKIYVTIDNRKMYRWNGAIYQELAVTDISSKENIANKQNTLSVDGTGVKYPTVDAVNDGLALKVPKVVNSKSTTPIVGGDVNARMCVSNGMLYVTEYVNNKVGVFSLENPMSPTKIYDFTVGSRPRHVLVSGRNMFVSCNAANKIEIYDIQNPQSELKIGEIPTGSEPKMFELIGSDLFVICAGTSKVEKYKISMPDSSLSNFSYYKVGDVSVGLNPLGISYNGDGLLAVCGNGDNIITILSTDTLASYSAPFGGAGHGTCAWFNKTQLLVTDWTTESLLSLNYSNLLIPTLSSSITVSENPEQIEIVGDKAYIPSLRIGVSPSYLDFIDLSNAKSPVKIKSETLTVNAAGFTAPYTDGLNTYLYVNGHESPFNIDAVKIDNGNFHRNEMLMEDSKYINKLSVSNLTTNTVDESKRYINATNPKTISETDNVIRLESGTTTLPNPNKIRDGKVIVLSNVSNSGNVTVTNAFSGIPSFTLYPYESISIQATKNGATYKWDAIGGRKNLPSIYDIGVGVGIGTTSPNFQNSTRKVLDINGTSESMLALSIGGSAVGYINASASSVEISAQGSRELLLSNNGAKRLTFSTAGTATFSSSVTATNGIFTGDLSIGAISNVKQFSAGMQTTIARFREREYIDDFAISTNMNDFGTKDNSLKSGWRVLMGASSDAFKIGRSAVGSVTINDYFDLNNTGAATFSSSLTATSLKITSLSGASPAPVMTDVSGNIYRGTASASPLQLKDFYTDVSNIGTVSSPLAPATITANRLNAAGEKLVAVYGGTFNDATASSRLTLGMFGIQIADTGELTMSVTGAWVINATIVRTGTTTARSVVNISTPGASTASYTKYTSLTGLNFAAETTLQVSGQAGGATGGSNDITSTYGNILWQPAAL